MSQSLYDILQVNDTSLCCFLKHICGYLLRGDLLLAFLHAQTAKLIVVPGQLTGEVPEPEGRTLHSLRWEQSMPGHMNE